MKRSIAVTFVVALMSFAGTGVAAADDCVALGDSYSSGTGTRTYFHAGCQRSIYAYPSPVEPVWQRPAPATGCFTAAVPGNGHV